MSQTKISDYDYKYRYFIRIDEYENYENLLMEEFSGNRYSLVLCVKHKGKSGRNPHFHLTLTTNYKKDALRKRLKQVFTKGSGNAHLSIKDWDGNMNANSYMFKELKEMEPLQVVLNRGYTTEKIQQFRAQSDSIKKAIADNSPQQKVAKIFELAQNERIDFNDTIQVVYVIWKFYMEEPGSWMPDRRQVERYTDVLCRMNAKYQEKINPQEKPMEKFFLQYASKVTGRDLTDPMNYELMELRQKFFS